jgi:hypothetical protein
LPVIVIGNDRDFLGFPVSWRLACLAGNGIVALYDCFGGRLVKLADVYKACDVKRRPGEPKTNARILAVAYAIAGNDNIPSCGFVSCKEGLMDVFIGEIKLCRIC